MCTNQHLSKQQRGTVTVVVHTLLLLSTRESATFGYMRESKVKIVLYSLGLRIIIIIIIIGFDTGVESFF